MFGRRIFDFVGRPSDGTYMVAKILRKGLKKYKIPATYRGKAVTELWTRLFADEQAERVILPPTIDKIGVGAFQNCTRLTAVNLGETAVKNIEENAFRGCTSLAEVTLPDTTTDIGARAFAETTTLARLDIPASVERIGDGAFANSGLVHLNLPEILPELPAELCNGCTKLAEVTLPATLREIGERAFCGCTALYTISLPPVMERIGTQAFAGSAVERDVPAELRARFPRAFSTCLSQADAETYRKQNDQPS